MAVQTTTPAARAVQAVVDKLQAAGIGATRDEGAFFPQPVGVLVGQPALTSRLLAARSFTVPVLAVSADPLNSPARFDRVYALADDVSSALNEAAYRVSSWQQTRTSEPLFALEISAIVTVLEE